MAKVVNRDQQVRVGVLAPKPVYSRVLGLQIAVAGGVGNSQYCYTPMLGNTIRLLRVTLHVFGSLLNVQVGGFFYIATGQTAPRACGEIATRWELIIPMTCGAKKAIYWWGRQQTFAWDMDVLYTGYERRFAICVENTLLDPFHVLVWFQIAEG